MTKNVRDCGILVNFKNYYLTQQEGYCSTLHWGQELHFTPKPLSIRISSEIQWTLHLAIFFSSLHLKCDQHVMFFFPFSIFWLLCHKLENLIIMLVPWVTIILEHIFSVVSSWVGLTLYIMQIYLCAFNWNLDFD